ncbi:two-component regulator propeller domain-containing protein [Anaerolineales bacterium HSG24]|nr:two-component regulator propeller domain-containing protein [Anaerolineales bacterium HSG24]
MKYNSKIVVIFCLIILISHALAIPNQAYGFFEPLWQAGETPSTNITLVTYGKYEGLLAKDIKGIVQDDKGYLYLGTNEGIWKYNGSQFYQLLSERNGLSSNSVFGLILDSQGNMWASTNKGLNKISNGEVVAVFSPDATIWTKAIEDTAGNIWFVDLAGGLLNKVQNDELVVTYSAEDIDALNGIFKLFPNSEGGIWVGTSDGLLKFNDDHVEQHITADDGLRSNRVHEIFADQDNSVWVSDIDGGLSEISDGTSQVEPIAGYLETALVDTDNTFWLGSSSGLVRYRDGEEPVIYTIADGLADNYVLNIFEDRDGNIWIGTANGVSKITKKTSCRGI